VSRISIVTVAFISIIAQIIGAMIAYKIGITDERIAWNDLIKLGIINNPKDGPALSSISSGNLHGETLAAFDRVVKRTGS